MKNEWKEAVIEELIACCILTEADEGDPYAAVKKLCEWERTVALDPAVSEPAAKLHAEIERLRELLKVPNPARDFVNECNELLRANAKLIEQKDAKIARLRKALELIDLGRADGMGCMDFKLTRECMQIIASEALKENDNEH